MALVGPAGVGKTRLGEALAAAAGVVRRAAGPEERPLLEVDARVGAAGGGLIPAWAWLGWGEGVVHLVDTPGAPEAAYPAALARWGAELDVVVLDGRVPVDGAVVVEDLARGPRPAVVVLTRAERGVDLDARCTELAAATGRRVVPLQAPLVDGGRLVDLVDLLPGRTATGAPIPADRLAAVAAARERSLEAIAEGDGAALDAFLEALDLPEALAWEALAREVAAGRSLPVLVAAPLATVGAASVLDAVWALTPPPSGRPDAACVLEVVGAWIDGDGAPVTMLRVAQGTLAPNDVVVDGSGRSLRVHRPYRVRGPRRAVAERAIPGEVVGIWEPLDVVPGESLGAEGRPPPDARPPMAWRRLCVEGGRHAEVLETGLATLLRLDPSLRASRVGRGCVDVAGPSPAHLDLVERRLAERFGVVVQSGPQPVDDQERPSGTSGVVLGRCTRPDRGELVERATVEVIVGPSEDDAPLWLEIEVDGEDLPEAMRPAVEEGMLAALAAGGPSGLPVVGVHVRVVAAWVDVLDGEPHHVAEAAADAVRVGLAAAGTRVWEPWTDVLAVVPEAAVGAVLSEIGAQRGRAEGLDVSDGETSIRARLPDTQLEALGARITALTRGRGFMFTRPSHHEPLPDGVAAAGRGGRATPS